MRFGSVCSGIEAASVAFGPLGWAGAWFAEIEPFPCAVLAHHYPNVPNLGDMLALPARIASGEVEAPDFLCGGTPCQAFSVAGLRKSLDDARGNLSLTFCEIANAIDHARSGSPPAIILWENVPGVLSTSDNAFGCFLAGLAGEDDALQPAGGKWSNAGAVYGPRRTVAWRTLDAQFFGLAQRRRRVFVVASARDDFDPVAVLFEFDGVRRDTAPRRETGQGVAGTLDARAAGGGFPGTDGATSGHVVAALCAATGQSGAEIGIDICLTLNCNHEAPYAARTLRGVGFDASEDATGRGTPIVSAVVFDTTQITSAANRSNPAPGDPCHPLATGQHAPLLTVGFNARQDPDSWADRVGPLDTDGSTQVVAFSSKDFGADATAELSPTLRASGTPALTRAMQVRRLTPRECERLQGFPDDYTLIPHRGKPAADSPRYKALGNSWAVPCVRWIGARIQREVQS